MKKFIRPLFAALCGMYLITPIVKAQEATQTGTLPAVTLGENVTMKIGGFLRADAYFDTRKNDELVDGLFNFYPKNELLDPNKNDLNAVSQFRMAATASRLNAKFSGPDVLNAKTSSLIEFDFTGVNGYGLRLRHAWIKLNWEKSELLFGRFWHPLMALDVLSNVVALSTGAPFTVFNRCEQIRFTKKLGNFSAFGAISAQMNYGFPEYAPNVNPGQTQLIPDLTANLQYKSDAFIIGVSGNFKSNQPASSFESPKTKNKFKIDDKVNSIALSGYAQVAVSALKIKAGALYGQNMHELLMLGGYALEKKDSTGYTYTTTNTLNLWGNIIYGKDLQFSVFCGYAKNLGSSSKTVIEIWGRPWDKNTGNSIDNLIRIAPSITYKTGKLMYQVELEHNIAAYGKVDLLDNSKVKDTKSISNTRVQLSATFFF